PCDRRTSRDSMMRRYADLEHVVKLPPEAMQWSTVPPEPEEENCPSAASSFKRELEPVLADALDGELSRTIREEAAPDAEADPSALAERLAKLSVEQRLALQELLSAAERQPAKPALRD
ncbi:unnamed protein product, partial [Effrenium voratum]